MYTNSITMAYKKMENLNADAQRELSKRAPGAPPRVACPSRDDCAWAQTTAGQHSQSTGIVSPCDRRSSGNLYGRSSTGALSEHGSTSGQHSQSTGDVGRVQER